MTRHTFRFGRRTFKHMINTGRWGTTWLLEVAEKWHNELIGGCMAASWGSSWRKNSPSDITYEVMGKGSSAQTMLHALSMYSWRGMLPGNTTTLLATTASTYTLLMDRPKVWCTTISKRASLIWTRSPCSTGLRVTCKTVLSGSNASWWPIFANTTSLVVACTFAYSPSMVGPKDVCSSSCIIGST